jgi:hypothetical protein
MSSKKITRIQIETHKVTVIRSGERTSDEPAEVAKVRNETIDPPKPFTNDSLDRIIDQAIAAVRTPTR